jgi:C-terminal processing protease CtpA/Prc
MAAAQNPPVPQSVQALPPFPIESPDKAYADQPYPSDELRMLSATKIWGAFHYFFAYKDLMDEDWDEDFAQFLPRFEAAKSARDYDLAVSEMVVRVDDSHASVDSDTLTAYFGEAPPPLRLRLIEKKPMVTRVLDEAKAAGIVPGDIIIDVDHNDTVERANIQAKYVSASTRAWLGDRIMQRLLNGPEGSIATLKIKSAGGQEKEVQLKRSNAYRTQLEAERDGDTVRMLPGGIGYADLNRLTRETVDSMWDKLHEAKFIVFDMRGQPATGAAEIAARLAKERGLPGTIVNGPLALVPDVPTPENVTQTSSYFFVQSLPKSSQPAYSGKTVMLVDERTIGPAERTALFFESANNTSFVGSPSAGAISDETNFVVPGGIVIGLSGRDVRHGNSGQLQRLGIQPAVAVMPTINGIRRGNDEVLEKALEYVAAQ